ncbi:MAG: NAD(P)H-dependent oxidoreductase [Pyrinomonadaceae bacterium]
MPDKKILLILGHPDGDSFCGALADAYQSAANDAGHELRRIDLGKLNFDPILYKGYKEIQELEPDLVKAQEDIIWSDHLVFVYPTWWATIPALLKGFIDRVFLPGFAFKYHENDPWWDKLLAGRSARLITTMDAPLIYFRLAYFSPGTNAMKRATLKFSGIKPVGVTAFGQVKDSDESKRAKWIGKIADLGRRGV